MSRYKHIFFDLDHTLWDFNKNSVETLTEIYQEFSLSNIIADESAFISFYQEINDRLWNEYRQGNISKESLRSKRFFETLKKFGSDSVALAKDIGDYYVYHSPQKTSLLPNTIETLKYLQGKYELHIITNGFEEVQHIKLERSFLKSFFRHVITSERAGAKKPAKTIFEHALDLADCSVNESIMIGDSYEADILGAKKFGMDQIYFCENAHWEGGEATHSISDLIELKSIL